MFDKPLRDNQASLSASVSLTVVRAMFPWMKWTTDNSQQGKKQHYNTFNDQLDFGPDEIVSHWNITY